MPLWQSARAMNLKPFLLCSLLLNIALLGAIAWLLKTRPGPNTPASQATEALAPAPQPVVPLTPADPAEEARPAKPFDWRMVESEDYKKYIANLRSIGCPEETIRDIITADVNKLFESRKKALGGTGAKKFEYWKGGMQMYAQVFDEEKIKKEQELAREKRALLTELLGS